MQYTSRKVCPVSSANRASAAAAKLKKVIVWSFALVALGLIGCDTGGSAEVCGVEGSYSETTQSDGVQSYCSYIVIVSGFRRCPASRPFRFEIPAQTPGGRGAVICSNKRIDSQQQLPASVCAQVSPLCTVNDGSVLDGGSCGQLGEPCCRVGSASACDPSQDLVCAGSVCGRPQPPPDSGSDGPRPGFRCGNIACAGGQVCLEFESGIVQPEAGIGRAYACGELPSECSLSPCQLGSCPTACAPLCSGRGIREIRTQNDVDVVVCFGV